MRLSTSSSEYGAYYCGRFFLLSVFITTLLLLASWEVTLRSLGFRPSVRDSDILWSQAGEKAIAQQAALVGASRFTAALDPESLAEIFGGKVPAQLATDGSQALYPFYNLTEDPRFKGTILLSVVPGSFFIPLAPWQKSMWEAKFNCAKNCPLISRLEHSLRLPLQERLALYAPETALSVNLQQVLNRKTVFPGVVLDPPWAQRALYQRDRTKKDAHEGARWEESHLNQLREFWPFIVENWDAPRKLTGQQLTDHFAQIQTAINKLNARGGKVIFLRMQSDGKLKEAEEKYFPRNEYWDKLISLDGALFIHSRDYPELNEFRTADDSHLSPADAPIFSKTLAQLILRIENRQTEGLPQN